MRTIVFACLTRSARGSVTSQAPGDAGGGSAEGDGSDAPPRHPASLSGSPTTGTDFGDAVLGQSTRSSYMISNDGELPTTPVTLKTMPIRIHPMELIGSKCLE